MALFVSKSEPECVLANVNGEQLEVYNKGKKEIHRKKCHITPRISISRIDGGVMLTIYNLAGVDWLYRDIRGTNRCHC